MFNRIEKTRTLRRALVLAGLVMGSVSSAAFAAAPAHTAAKPAQLSARLYGAYGYAAERGNSGIQTSGPIYRRGVYLGQDPDPSIRFELLRDGGVHDGR
jgi:hypothetical protein